MPEIIRFDREEFITERWDYRAGQHVSIIGETGNGKTTLANQLLAASVGPGLTSPTPTHPNGAPIDIWATILAMKPEDDTIDRFLRKMRDDGKKFRKISTWPATPSVWYPGRPEGYVLWPKHVHNTEIDRTNHADIFGRAMMNLYGMGKKKGGRIIFADEIFSLTKELKLGDDLDTIWTKGRSMGCGLWGATQQPAWIPSNMYRQAQHLFLDYPSDKRSRERYREIGGMDPDIVLQAVWKSSEEEFSWVYLKPNGRRSQICIVGA